MTRSGSDANEKPNPIPKNGSEAEEKLKRDLPKICKLIVQYNVKLFRHIYRYKCEKNWTQNMGHAAPEVIVFGKRVHAVEELGLRHAPGQATHHDLRHRAN